jgi:hypothetical protein
MGGVKAKVGAVLEGAGKAFNTGGTEVSKVAYRDTINSGVYSAANYAKARALQTGAVGARTFGNAKAAKQLDDAAMLANVKSTLYGARATVGAAVNTIGNKVATVGDRIAKKGARLQQEPAKPAMSSPVLPAKALPASTPDKTQSPPNTAPVHMSAAQGRDQALAVTGTAVVAGLAIAAKTIRSTATTVSGRVKSAANTMAMNKPHPDPSNSEPGANADGSNNSRPGKRGFQNAKNQAAAQKARGAKYDGPTA